MIARKSIEDSRAQIEVRRKTLKARSVKQESKEDTHRKILLGALVQHRIGEDRDGELSSRLDE